MQDTRYSCFRRERPSGGPVGRKSRKNNTLCEDRPAQKLCEAGESFG